MRFFFPLHLDSTCSSISIALLIKSPSTFYCDHAETASNLVDMFEEGNSDLLHHTLKSLKNHQSEVIFLNSYSPSSFCSARIFVFLYSLLGNYLADFTANIPLHEKIIIITRPC